MIPSENVLRRRTLQTLCLASLAGTLQTYSALLEHPVHRSVVFEEGRSSSSPGGLSPCQ